MVRGHYGYQPALPASPGIEGVGIVEPVGPGVQGPMPGTRVVFVATWNNAQVGYDESRFLTNNQWESRRFC
jgi:NADPH:quinone reductase-like Zn-dependent oxidoreductase